MIRPRALCFSWHSEQNVRLILPFLQFLRDECGLDVRVLTSEAGGKVRLLREGFATYTLNEIIRHCPPTKAPQVQPEVLLGLTEQDRLINWRWTPEDPLLPETPPRDASPEYARWKAVQIFRAYAWLVRSLSPSVLFTWNGSMLVQNALSECAREIGVPVYFMERGLLPGSLVVDPEGVNSRSALAGSQRLGDWLPAPTDEERRRLENYCQALHDNASTIVMAGARATVTEARAAIGLGPKTKAVLLPLQIEADSNIVLHSPLYKSMPEIIRAAEGAARANGDVCIVVRPHPEDRARRDALDALASTNVAFSWDLDLHSLLAASDAVITVNSTVGLEALLQAKPVVALGRSIYASKGFTYDVTERSGLPAALRDALDAKPRTSPQPEVLHFLAILLRRLAFSYDSSDPWGNREYWRAIVRDHVAGHARPMTADSSWTVLERTNELLSSALRQVDAGDAHATRCLILGVLDGLTPAPGSSSSGRPTMITRQSTPFSILRSLARRYDTAICADQPRSMLQRVLWDAVRAREKLVLG